MILLTDDDTLMLLTDDDALAKDMSKESSKDSAKERSKGSWALGQGIVQGNNNYRFLGTFLGQLLGQGPKNVEMLSP